MKYNFIVLLRISILFLLTNQVTSNDILEKITNTIASSLEQIISNALVNNTKNISKSCYNTLNQTYLSNTELSEKAIYKLIRDSSINSHDITTYGPCIDRTHGYNLNINSKYLLLSVHNPESYQTFGLCVIDGCSNFEYRTLFIIGNDYFAMNLTNKNSTIYALTISDTDYNFNLQIYLLNFLPFYLLLIQILLVIFPKIPYMILMKCIKNNKQEDINVTRKKKKWLKMFDFDYNWAELFITSNSYEENTWNNDSGLNYILGIRGISMIFMICGALFYNLYNSPIALKLDEKIFFVINSFSFGIFYFGRRYSMKLLYSCSGYLWLYKWMAYLDDVVEIIQQNEQRSANSYNKYTDWKRNKNQSIYLNTQNIKAEDLHSNEVDNSNSINSKSSLSTLKIQNVNTTSRLTIWVKLSVFKVLFKFIFYQFHKYILLLLMIFFCRYSWFYVILLIKPTGPMWVYLNKRILQSSDPYYFVLSCFSLSPLDISIRYANIFSYFTYVYNEVLFFIITSIFIFYGYKYKFRIDSIILITVGWIVLLKIIWFFFWIEWDFIPTKFYSFRYFGLFEESFYYNYIYYLIGAYFSFINYTLQKGIITYEEADRLYKPYLLIFIKMWKWWKKKSIAKTKYDIEGMLLLLLIVVMVMTPTIIYKAFGPAYIDNLFVQFYYSIDTDCVVVLVHCVAFLFYIKGSNAIKKFLTAPFWSFFNKIYFQFILLINPIILYILFQSETWIHFDIPNLLFYSSICGSFIFILSSILYVLFEIPYKRMRKMVMTRTKHKEDSEILNNEKEGEREEDDSKYSIR